MKASYSNGFFDPTTGFLPLHEPLIELPSDFYELEDLLQNMPIQRADGTAGYLAIPGRIALEVDKLPDFTGLVHLILDDSGENVTPTLAALFRAYTFLSSAYLLEPSYQTYRKTGNYGRARMILPKQLAVPLVLLAEHLKVHPFLEYSYSYSLGNWKKLSYSGGMTWHNLEMIYSFSGTVDETGFIMVHVDINQHTPELVRSILGLVAAESDDAAVLQHLKSCLSTMKKINARRQTMWKASRWENYNDFRVFIMGSFGNEEVFSDGVIYEGTGETRPMQFRGQSGSQDTIIPMMDICFGVTDFYPQNELTSYLMDMRNYRPAPFRDFLTDLESCSGGLRERVEQLCGLEGLMYYLAIVEQIYLFRNGHWQFVQKYIMANTDYPQATGGTPIISWIPNQISATLELMADIFYQIEELREIVLHKLTDGDAVPSDAVPTSVQMMYQEIVAQLDNRCRLLRSQQEELQSRYSKDQASDVFRLNQKYGQSDLCPTNMKSR